MTVSVGEVAVEPPENRRRHLNGRSKKTYASGVFLTMAEYFDVRDFVGQKLNRGKGMVDSLPQASGGDDFWERQELEVESDEEFLKRVTERLIRKNIPKEQPPCYPLITRWEKKTGPVNFGIVIGRQPYRLRKIQVTAGEGKTTAKKSLASEGQDKVKVRAVDMCKKEPEKLSSRIVEVFDAKIADREVKSDRETAAAQEIEDVVDGEVVMGKGELKKEVEVQLPVQSKEIKEKETDVFQEYLDNPDVTHVQVEGCVVSKEALVEWAVKVYETSCNQSLVSEHLPLEYQEDDGAAGGDYLSSGFPVPTTEDAQAQYGVHHTNLPEEAATAPRSRAVSVASNPQSLLGAYSLQTEAPTQQATPAAASNLPPKYLAAKAWRPKNADQALALEQAMDDLCNVLLVAKGCRLHSILSEYRRQTQETLDFSKMGIPDVKTLLVQMEDKIFLKKSKWKGHVYVYPNLSSANFDAVTHIADFVMEQRDNLQMIPDPNNSSVLEDVQIHELFEETPPYYSQPYNNWRNGNPQSYYNYNPYLTYKQVPAPLQDYSSTFYNSPYYLQYMQRYQQQQQQQQFYQQFASAVSGYPNQNQGYQPTTNYNRR